MSKHSITQINPDRAPAGIDFKNAAGRVILSVGYETERDRDREWSRLEENPHYPLWPAAAVTVTAWERKPIPQRSLYQPRRNPITGRYIGGERRASNGGI